jgi:thiol-disulfide isomerase/thioredoxin
MKSSHMNYHLSRCNLKNRLYIFLVINLIPVLLFASGESFAAGSPPLIHSLDKLGQITAAPALSFLNIDEELVDIKTMKGKVVIVNFWATWCPPCRKEMGSLERLYQATKGHSIEVLAVNIGEAADQVSSFMGTVEPSTSFQILFDLDGISMGHWRVRGLPTTYIVDKNGKLAYRAVGGREFDHVDIIEKVLQLAK